MEERLFTQLAELSKAFAKIGLEPVICGGLGIYLCFYKSQDEVQKMIRATNDIDLMLTPTQVPDKARCEAIANIINDQLEYAAAADGRCFRFKKDPQQLLDILAPPLAAFKSEGSRVKFLRSRLHGRLTPEAHFIEQDLRTISLLDLFQSEKDKSSINVKVPSPTNSLILKLFAFNDRTKGQRMNVQSAQAHAWDIYVIIMLTNRNDYLEGQRFLKLHTDSDIIQTARQIVSENFSTIDQSGWQRVLQSSDFYPNLNRQQKEDKLESAKQRLMKWFNVSEH
jgi:hypothetical protein